MKKKTLYMLVSEDKYEFPEIIADSVKELAIMAGVSQNAISSAISHAKSGRHKYSKYVKVEIESEE